MSIYIYSIICRHSLLLSLNQYGHPNIEPKYFQDSACQKTLD